MRYLTLIIVISLTLNLIYASKSPSEKSDEELHENQIPPPSEQPEPEVVKEALKENFKKMDKDMDKLITEEEVRLWMQSVHDKLVSENTKRQWEYYEPENSEVHSWKDYEPEVKEALTWDKYANRTFPPEVLDENERKDLSEEERNNIDAYKVMIKRAERRWKVADSNNDSILVYEEFRDFVHPEESELDKVKEVIVVEALEDMDKDSNGDISYEEYITHISSLAQDDEKSDPSWLKVQETHYKTYLDKDKDGVLNMQEMKEWLIPPYDRHDAEGQRLISLADTNNDSKLSINEILEKFESFLPLLPPDFWSKFAPVEENTEPPTASKHDEF